MIKRLGTLAAACAVVSLVFMSGPAYAGSQTKGLTVNGSVGTSCTALSSAQTLTFPAYDFQSNASTPDDTGPVTYTTNCTSGATVHFSVDGGANYAHTSGTRAMKSASANDYLDYGLFQDSGRSTPWAFDPGSGAGTNGPALTGAGNSSVLTLTIYGRIPAGQDETVASDYTDAVTVAINF